MVTKFLLCFLECFQAMLLEKLHGITHSELHSCFGMTPFPAGPQSQEGYLQRFKLKRSG